MFFRIEVYWRSGHHLPWRPKLSPTSTPVATSRVHALRPPSHVDPKGMDPKSQEAPVVGGSPDFAALAHGNAEFVKALIRFCPAGVSCDLLFHSNFLSQCENFKLSWLPNYWVLMKS